MTVTFEDRSTNTLYIAEVNVGGYMTDDELIEEARSHLRKNPNIKNVDSLEVVSIY